MEYAHIMAIPQRGSTFKLYHVYSGFQYIGEFDTILPQLNQFSRLVTLKSLIYRKHRYILLFIHNTNIRLTEAYNEHAK